MSSTAISFMTAGFNDESQLCRYGDSIPSRTQLLKTANLISVSTGGTHCAAVYSDGAVYGWGYNDSGRIGLPFDKTKISKPTLIENLPPIMKVICGFSFTLFLSKNNEVFITISNKKKQILLGKVETSGRCVSIFGYSDPWIVCEDNSIYRISNFQKGRTIRTKKFELPKTAKSKVIKAIISLFSTSSDICLTESGEVFGIGGVANDSKEFVEIESLKNQRIKKISGIYSHIVALTEDGKVFVWGKNESGALGIGNEEDQMGNFVEIPKFSYFNIIDISAGGLFSVFVDDGGNVWANGYGEYGKTLFGDEKNRLSPEKVNSIDKAVAASCGLGFTFVQIGGSPII